MSLTILRTVYGKTVSLTPEQSAALDRVIGTADTKKHDYSEIGRVDKWVAKVSPLTGYGYYEHDVHGEGGGLWFEGKELTDFDGRACLPRDVAKALIALGYTVDPINYAGEPL